MYNEEKILDRIEELEEYIQNFPDSKLAPIMQEEIDYLNSLRGIRSEDKIRSDKKRFF